MKTPRPASHWFAIAFFVLMALACAATGFSLFTNGEEEYLMQLAAFVLSIVALGGLGTQSKWAHIYCSVLLALLPLSALFSLAMIVLRAENVSYISLLPLFIVSVLMLVLFYRFAFGQASRAAFNASRV
jgi:hypothetical protein